MPHRASALTFVGGEEVVELEHAGEEHEQGVARRHVRQRGDGLVQPAQREELAVAKKIVPRAVAVADGLARVAAVGEFPRRQENASGGDFLAKLRARCGASSVVLRRGAEILFFAAAGEHEFRVEPMGGRRAARADGRGDGKGVLAMRAVCFCPARRAGVGVEIRRAGNTMHGRIAEP